MACLEILALPHNEVARLPGMSIAVAVDGRIVWAEGFGFADVEQCVPVTPRTEFRIGSTSKPLTAAGAALHYDQGRRTAQQSYIVNISKHTARIES